MNFEETEEKLTANVASPGFDLRDLTKRKKLLIDYVSIERSQITEAGEYKLDGLFIRLAHAVKTIKAKGVVLDTVARAQRGEPSRLFRPRTPDQLVDRMRRELSKTDEDSDGREAMRSASWPTLPVLHDCGVGHPFMRVVSPIYCASMRVGFTARTVSD